MGVCNVKVPGEHNTKLDEGLRPVRKINLMEN